MGETSTKTPEQQEAQEKQDRMVRIKRIREDVELLEKEFPKCFSRKKPKPLKIGIQKDVVKSFQEKHPEFSKLRIRHALGHYINSYQYRECFANAESRVDLEGKKASLLSEEDKQDALKKIEEIKSKRKIQQKEEGGVK